MVDERTLDLIHAELDDELDPAARAELERRLDAAADARRMREDLRRISEALGRMVPAEPPLTLRATVLGGIRPVAPARRDRSRILRHGWALAAGIVIGAIGAFGFEPIHTERPRFDPRELAGTIAFPAAESARTTGPVLSIATPELRGTVALQTADRIWVLTFDLDSAAPVSVQARFDASGLRFQGFAPADADATSLTTEPGSVSFVNRGPQRFALFFAPDAGGPIRLRFEASGRVLHEASLQIPAAVPGRDP